MACGWIILDKESGLFSRTASTRVARLFGARTSGHIGTLDPMASGVLPIAVGAATKMIPFVEDAHENIKEYLFSMRFGIATDTLDITGRETARNDFTPTVDAVLDALPQFIGEISQIPPVYSAVHIAGRRAYELARGGMDTAPAPRTVHIYALEFLGRDGSDWNFRLRCSRGTYVRALVRDIARAVGAVATTTMIRRTQSGGFDIKNAVTLDFLEKLVNNGTDIKDFLKSPDHGLGDIPVVCLDDKSAALYQNGGFILVGGASGLRRVYSGDVFIGIGRIDDTGMLRPKRTI